MKTEDWEQRQLVQWARGFPWGRLLFHVPNENHHHDSRLGVRPGVPDLMLPIPMGGKHGLFIEMKRADGGVLSTAQRDWLRWLTELGYKAVCCHGWQEARKEIEDYMLIDPANSARSEPVERPIEPADLMEGCPHAGECRKSLGKWDYDENDCIDALAKALGCSEECT